jgi:hypothetical protein
MPATKLPGTLKRSPKKARHTYEKALASAEKEYGDGQRAHRTAIAALKHSFEKVGDHWEPKDHKGPSDDRAAKRGKAARDGKAETAGGVDVKGHTKDQLVARAKRLGIKGTSKMKKAELGRAIARKQD